MRDLKDYITAAKGCVPVNPGSPFNVKADSASLSNFQKDDIARLFAQRTDETGQQITADALAYRLEDPAIRRLIETFFTGDIAAQFSGILAEQFRNLGGDVRFYRSLSPSFADGVSATGYQR
jgi:hypothetical protein